MSVLAPVREAAYRLLQDVASSWIRRRHARRFDEVACFCLFVGYPRSGHSLVGAMLNAHRDAVVAHELGAQDLILAGCSRDELYARILSRARWFHLRGDTSNYPYRIPDQWQGRFATLRVLGDKRGGAVTRAIAAHPDFLARVRGLVRVPLRLIHVVRNPFDNIAAIAKWEHLSLAESADFYFTHCRTTSSLPDLDDATTTHTLRHEALVRDPRSTLSTLCTFLGLEPDPPYLDACAAIVFPEPTYSRRKVTWPPGLIASIERRASEHRRINGYAFDDDETHA